ncbi:MAG: S8 family serine peptidase [Thermoplasmatales archaeon]|nr:S8 family serine peptidase [Thermoplasmatales archaeon]
MKKRYIALAIIGMIFIVNGSSVSTIGLKIVNQVAESIEIEEPIINDYDEIDNIALDDFMSDSNFDSNFIPRVLIVKFKEENTLSFLEKEKEIIITGIESVDRLNKKYAVTFSEKIFNSIPDCSLSNVYKFTLTENADILAAAEEYAKDPNIKYAEPNYILHTCKVPNDPFFNEQWALHNIGQTGGTSDADINAPEAWNVTTGDQDIVIAVIDSGVDYNHPDLADNIWVNEDEIPDNNVDDDGNDFVDDVRGWDFVNKDNDPMDSYGHGTHCAGIAAAVTNNSIGVAGVCWNSKIMSIKTGNTMSLNMVAVAKGIIYAVKNGADVISMSFGSRAFMKLLRDVTNFAYINGVVLVAGAGNNPKDQKFYPAALDNVIAVGATNNKDKRAWFSTYGKWIDVAAPGVDILSLRAKDTDMYSDETHIVDEDYYFASGTSMACPHVAGLAGLILSKYQDISPDLVRASIYYSADRLSLPFRIGRGRVNAYEMLIRGPGPAKSEITSPLHYEIVKGTIDIVGSATGDGFQYFVVEYCKGQYPREGSWIELVNSTTSIENDVLCSIDTTILDEGINNIRLKVVCSNGLYKDKIMIIVNNRYNTFIVDDDDGPGVDYTSIQDAIFVSGDGDSVYVHNGTYYEKLLIDKSITLTGENKNTTIISYNYSFFEDISLYTGSFNDIYIVKVTANRVNISGFTIVSEFTTVYNISSFNITYCVILLYDVQNCVVSSNKIGNNATFDAIGIKLEKSSNCLICCNTITFNWMGLRLEKSSKNIICNNDIINNFIGVRLVKMSNKNEILYNNFINDNPRFIYEHASFRNSYFNKWKRNYWDDWIGLKSNIFRLTPKRIPYRLSDLSFIFYLRIPRIRCNFDWCPAKEPYEIPSSNYNTNLEKMK